MEPAKGTDNVEVQIADETSPTESYGNDSLGTFLTTPFTRTLGNERFNQYMKTVMVCLKSLLAFGTAIVTS